MYLSPTRRLPASDGVVWPASAAAIFSGVRPSAAILTRGISSETICRRSPRMSIFATSSQSSSSRRSSFACSFSSAGV